MKLTILQTDEVEPTAEHAAPVAVTGLRWSKLMSPRDYALSHLLADPRLEGVRLRSPHTLRRFREATVYEVSRSG